MLECITNANNLCLNLLALSGKDCRFDDLISNWPQPEGLHLDRQACAKLVAVSGYKTF